MISVPAYLHSNGVTVSASDLRDDGPVRHVRVDPLSNDPTGDEVPVGIRGEAGQLRSGPAEAAAVAVGHPRQGNLVTSA